jgi:hypothetical protein
MSVGASILLAIATTALGVLATWFFAWLYFRKSSSDFRHLAGNHQKLLQAVNTLGRILEQAGIGHPTYDGAGNLTGIVITASLRDVVLLSDSATATVVRGQPPQYDRQHEQPPSPEPEGDHA